MAQVTVTIAGRSYRMACGDGEEQHLDGLARLFDGKIDEMRTAFGELGDMRLHVMAALTLADEISEMRRRVQTLEGTLESLKGDAGFAETRAGEVERLATDAIREAAERIEKVARALAPQTG